MKTAKIALATCVKLPEPDVDEELLVRALEQRGARVRMLAWDDPAQAAEPGEIVVVRSTWNYYADVDAFAAWIDRTAAVTRIMNPAAILRWNVDKTYLQELEARGIATVPTEWEATDVGEAMRAHGWDAVVVKPVVSAGSFSTRRFTLAEADLAQAFFASAGRAMMVQRWVPAVETSGERSLVWLAGSLSHAIRKSPRFADGTERVSEAIAIADDERAFAERILAPIAGEILYARVDIVRDDAELRLMELELVEPSLFLRQHSPAADRFADAIVAIG